MFLWLLEPRSCLPARALAASRQSRVVAQCPSMLLRYIFGCTFVIDGGLYILAHIRGLFSRLSQPCATSSGSQEVTLFSVSWADAQRMHVTLHSQNFLSIWHIGGGKIMSWIALRHVGLMDHNYAGETHTAADNTAEGLGVNTTRVKAKLAATAMGIV